MKKLLFVLTFIATFFFAAPAFAYTVQKGDTMTSIAHKHGMTLDEIAAANPQIDNLDLILVGQEVHINEKEVKEKADNKIVKKEKPRASLKQYRLLSLFNGTSKPLKINLTTQVSSATSDVNDNATSSNNEEVMVANNINTNEGDPASENVVESSTEDDSLTIADFTDAEIDLLARIVRAEAQGEPFEGKVAVAAVVLNRLESPQYPDTLREVIYQKNQFQPVRNGQVNKPADEASFEAVYAALSDMRDIAEDSLFFYNPKIAKSRWLDTRQTTLVIGQHVFKK